MSATKPKTDWRRDMRQLRDQQEPRTLPPLLEALTASSVWIDASTIASYCQTGSEQTPTLIEEAAKELGKTVVFPRVLGAGEMVFKAPRTTHPFEIGHYGIAEPPATAETIPVATIDFFLVPLLACDQYGTRLGYGGGLLRSLARGSSGFQMRVRVQLSKGSEPARGTT